MSDDVLSGSMKFSPRVRAVARFFSLLGIGVWLGGLGFVGVCAPAIFSVAKANGVRSLGPQIIGAALAGFTPVTYVCALLALAGWVFDPVRKGNGGHGLWRLQGSCLGVMLAMAIYTGAFVMPQIQRIQPAVIVAKAAGQTNETTRKFGKLHGLYGGATLFIVALGLLSLGSFAARSAREADDRLGT